MKLISAILFFGVSADYNQMQADFQANIDLMPPNTRALLKTDMGLLDQYGCWCYFQNDHGKGKSKPVNEIDEFCQVLHHGYSCIIKDTDAMGAKCTPWEIPYNSAISTGIVTGITMENLKTECNVQNPNDTCESWTCMVENWFVIQFLKYSLNGGTIATEFQHSEGFTPADSCWTDGPNGYEKACCGAYPERFPFTLRNGERACCVDKTYNTEYYSCCSGVIMSEGSC